MMFNKEREAVIDAAETARDGIGVALAVATVAVLIAVVALAVAVMHRA